MCNRFFSDFFCKLSKEKQSFVVNLPFMFYMPYSTQLVQEMASKDQETTF